MANTISHTTINVTQTTDQKYICWVNGTSYTLNTSSIEVDELTPDTVYSIGCVEVDEDGHYQCTEYNTTVVTGENVLIYIHMCTHCVYTYTSMCIELYTMCNDCFTHIIPKRPCIITCY